MVSEADDLQHVRDEIRKLYDMSKKVIVAPCKCKLYISRSTEIIDYEGKTSPNWFYFASGLTTIVYDPQTNELMLTLFDTTTIRLLWMLKMSEKTHIYAPNSSFHVLNTRDDFNEHVGFLYESRDVASLLLNTFSLLTAQQFGSKLTSSGTNKVDAEEIITSKTRAMKETKGEEQNALKSNGSTEKKRKNLLRSLTFHVRRSSSQSAKRDSLTANSSCQPSRPNQVNKEDLIDTQRGCGENGDFVSPSFNTGPCNKVKEQEKRRRRLSRRSKTVGPESIPCVSSLTNANLIRHSDNRDNKRSSVPCFIVGEVEDIFPSRETIASISGKSISPRGATSQVSLEEQSPAEESSSPRNEPEVCDSHKRGSIFRRTGRKISRSLSEKLPSRPHVKLRRDKQAEQNSEDNFQGDTRYDRSCKPRASSDSLLLKGSAIDCIVETGHMAKYQRERKCWMTILENETVMTTDLCVTEL